MNSLKFHKAGFVDQTTANRISSSLVFAACLALSVFTSSPLDALEGKREAATTFLVVRHAERAGNLDKLTSSGEERAKILAKLGRAFNVQEIYSTDTTRTKGTAQPLADALGIEIKAYGRITREWIASLKEKHTGQVVLIVGHSNTTGVIAGLLAKEKPFKIDHDEYDALFIVQASNAKAIAMRLRYGGSAEGSASADPDKMAPVDSLPSSK